MLLVGTFIRMPMIKAHFEHIKRLEEECRRRANQKAASSTMTTIAGITEKAVERFDYIFYMFTLTTFFRP